MPTFLIVLDIPSIKDYVFATDRLIQIRGASALLDHLNRVLMDEFLKKELAAPVECVFSGGGTAHFVIEAEREAILTALARLHSLFGKKSAGGIRLIYGLGELSGADYATALQVALTELQQRKEQVPHLPAPLLHTGFLRECDSCSAPAGHLITYGERDMVLCNSCLIKMQQGRQRGVWQELAAYLPADPDPDRLRPRDFEEIGARCQSAPGYVALIYADGNAMGKIIKRLRTIEEFRFFSSMVDQAIRAACFENIRDLCPIREDKLPVDILLLGGDDLLVYLAADLAIPFALAAARRFQEKTQAALARQPTLAGVVGAAGVTLSLGIAFGRSHTPFSVLLDQAEELLQSAKQAGAQVGGDSPLTYIDYHLASYFNQIRVADCRQNQLTLRQGPIITRLYQKPYSLEQLAQLWQEAQNWLAAKIPASRVKRLGYAPVLGKLQGTLAFLKAYVRAKEHHREVIWQTLQQFGCSGFHFPWRATKADEYTTMLLDLAELTEFASPT